jgi:hypothetical protein
MFDGHLLRFSRVIDTAGDAFTEALMRPILSAEGARQLTYEQAEDVKIAAGYPLEDEALDLPHGVAPRDILPLMEPVARRLASELRRSIDYLGGMIGRTGVDRIILSGSAGGMRNLDAVLQDELGTPVTFLDPVARAVAHWRLAICGARASATGGYSAILGYSLGGKRPINLLPSEERLDELLNRAARVRRATAPVALSFAVALALVGVPIARNYESARDAMERTATEIDARLRREADLRASYESALARAERAVAARGAVPDWQGMLKELSALLPEAARISEFSVRTVDGATLLSLAARIRASSAPIELVNTQLAVSLGASPFFENVRVLDASVEEHGRAGRFVATLEIVAGPQRPWEVER